MRMHFRPRLASYYKAGAVLGAIFDAALEVGYRHLLLASAPDFARQGRTRYTIDVSVWLPGLPRSDLRSQRRIISTPNLKPSPSSRGTRETADRCAPRVPGRSERARMARTAAA